MAAVLAGQLAACAREPRRQEAPVLTAPPPQVALPDRAPLAPQRQAGAFGPEPADARPAKIAEVYPGTGRSIDPDAARGRGTPREGDITLNFAETDVREVVQVMLRDILGVNYVIDPDVRGNVSLEMSRPIRKEDVVSVLEATLAGVGAALVNQGGIYRVVPDADARAEAGLSLGGVGAGYSVSGFPLSYIGAVQLQTVLQPLLPEGSVVRADGQRGLLMVAGSSEERRLAAETVRLFDVDQLSGSTALLESLQNVDARTVAFEMDNIFGGLENGPLAGQLRLIPIERMNALLILSKQPRYIEEARQWIARLDRTNQGGGRRLYVYYAQNGKAADLARTLKEIFQPGAAQPPGPGAPDAAGEPPPAGEAAPAPRLAPPGDIGDVRITADDKNNAILILATREEYELVQDVLTKLDLQPLAVLIEAQIVEVALRDQLRFGVQYFIKSGGLDIAAEGATVLSSGTSRVLQPAFPGFAFTLADTSQARFVLDTLAQLTEVNVISSPQVMVLDNQVATLRVGDQVPIVVQTSTSNLTADTRTVNAIEYRDTGVTLEVTPRVNASGLVTMEIAQEVSDVVVTDTSNIDSPTIRQRKIVSTVAVHSGQTIALGGLIRNQTNDSKQGIPGLNDLPLVGPLFGTQSSDLQRTELLVMLRPEVVRNADEARAVTDDLRQRYLGLLQASESMPQPRRFKRGVPAMFGLEKLF